MLGLTAPAYGSIVIQYFKKYRFLSAHVKLTEASVRLQLSLRQG